MNTDMMNTVSSTLDAPAKPGLWLPKFGGTTQFYFHVVSESSTCDCLRCEARNTSLIPSAVEL